MADELTTKRIINLPAESAPAAGDVLVVDNETTGTKKLPVSVFTEATAAVAADVNAMKTATAEDVGKALKAKTVTDGEVTEWEFGEAGGNVDPTLSIEGEAADAKATGDAIQILNDNVLSFTEMTPTQTANGWKIRDTDDGRAIGDSAYKLDKYAVSAGDVIQVVSDDRFQFNIGASVSTALPSNIVGEVYHTGTYILTVPETATYLIISTLKESTTAHAYSVSGLKSRVDAIEPKVDALEENANDTSIRLDAVSLLTEGNSPQLVDTSLYTLYSGSNYKQYRNVNINLSNNGIYCSNPVGLVEHQQLTVYDSSDNPLTFNNGSSANIGVSTLGYLEKLDSTHVKKYDFTSVENLKKGIFRSVTTYEFSGTIDHIKTTLTAIGATSGDFGITYNRITSVYIPYGYNITYNDEIFDDTWKNFVEQNRFYNVPEKRLNPWMQRSYALTDNLLDDRKFDWIPNNGYYKMKLGETIPVTGGRTIICNKRMYSTKSYDSNGVETSLGNLGENTLITLANDVVAIRFDVGIGTDAYLIPSGEYEPILLYYADDTLYPLDDVDRLPVPMAQINGWDINKNVYDMAIPEVDSNIVRMMKTFAIRELNHQRNAFRIGTFNIYVNNTRTNRSTIKKELETYGIDICAFQEVRSLDDSGQHETVNQMNIADYLKRGWQFDYCNTNQATENNKRAVVSAYEILSSEEFYYTNNPTPSNSFLKCVIKLPPYKHYVNGDNLTLSVYSYHGYFSSSAEGRPCVQDILNKVAEDTSDFVIVCGDTNDFSENKELWAMFANARLTPVHNGASVTVADGNTHSIDNIFVSSGITCLYYDVVRSLDWQYKPTPTSSPIPVSDHDFLYADLQFDFDAVIEARNQAGT